MTAIAPQVQPSFRSEQGGVAKRLSGTSPLTFSTLIMNIHFSMNNQTRFVKHGFSWQIFFFGPIAFAMRSQFVLAAACAGAMYAAYMATGFITIMVFDLDVEPARFFGIAAACGLVGYFGNRLSAHSYVKNGWVPVTDFPADWNTPQLIAPKAGDTKLC